MLDHHRSILASASYMQWQSFPVRTMGQFERHVSRFKYIQARFCDHKFCLILAR